MFKLLAKLNKLVLPSFTKRGLDPIKAKNGKSYNCLSILGNSKSFGLINIGFITVFIDVILSTFWSGINFFPFVFSRYFIFYFFSAAFDVAVSFKFSCSSEFCFSIFSFLLGLFFYLQRLSFLLLLFFLIFFLFFSTCSLVTFLPSLITLVSCAEMFIENKNNNPTKIKFSYSLN